MKTALILCLLFVGGLNIGSSEEIPRHHTEEGFQNYPITPTPPSLGVGFYLRRIWKSFFLPDVPEDHYIPEETALSQLRELSDKNTLTWIGESTFLIRLNGKNILTDPFFSDYAGPYSMGPQRFVKPGISANNLPAIDILIISHDHYDHLDEDFVDNLPRKENVHVFVPLKLKSFFIDRDYVHVHELDWNESYTIDGIKMTALPSVHYSGRGLSDKNKSLWCSWSIEASSGRYYFAGDTAYSPVVFNRIGEKFNSFDLALLTIGTYGNRKYGVDNHTTPEEAITQGMDVRANILVGIHWGTIEMSDEPITEPPIRFKAAAERSGIASDRIWIMKIGETRVLPRARQKSKMFEGNNDKQSK